MSIALVAQTTVAPFRAHVASVICPAYGWTWVQQGPTKDLLTKDGAAPVVLIWGSNKLLSFSTEGLLVDGQAPCKLQKLTNLLAGSKVMGETPDAIWASLPQGHPAKLGAKAALRAKAAEILQDMAEAAPAEAEAAPAEAEAAPAEAEAAPAEAEAPKPRASRKAGTKVVAATTLEDMGF